MKQNAKKGILRIPDTVFTALLCLLFSAALVRPSLSGGEDEKKIISLTSKIREAMSQVTSIRADFVQEKRLKHFSRPLTIRGTFALDRSGKMAWRILSPIRSCCILDSSGITQWDEESGKTIRIDATDNPSLQLFSETMTRYFTGDFQTLENGFLITTAPPPSPSSSSPSPPASGNENSAHCSTANAYNPTNASDSVHTSDSGNTSGAGKVRAAGTNTGSLPNAGQSAAEKFPVLILKPGEKHPASRFFREIRFVFAPELNHVRRVLIQEADGNSTLLTFENTVLNEALPPETWHAGP